MTEQLITAATVFRKKKGQIEWLIFKSDPKAPGYLPKGIVKRGESSVGAILRILREDIGMTVEVLEESGRITSSTNKEGARVNERTIYYLIEQSELADKEMLQRSGLTQKWGEYAQVARLLPDKERKMLTQARGILKELSKLKKN